VLDRDHNAALNILQKAVDRTGGQSGTGTSEKVRNASGQTPATRCGRATTGKVAG
jgi:putative transposase